MRIQGGVDYAELGGDDAGVRRLHGWVFAVGEEDVPLEVTISVNGVGWGHGNARDYRPDLTSVHPTGACAFALELRLALVASREILAGDALQVWARHPATGETARIPVVARVDEPTLARPRRIAAFTMVYNEPVNLPIWTRYYGRALGEENLYVLDHGSNDGSTRHVPGNVVRLPRDPKDSGVRAERCAAFQHFLLGMYDTVVYADCDEIVVPDPARYRDLRDYCERRVSSSVRTFGYEVLHDYRCEPPLDLTGSLLAQRSKWYFDRFWCKPLISGRPLAWAPGFHTLVDTMADVPVDPDLVLIHLRLMDLELALRKLRQNRGLDWSRREIERNWAWHQRTSDDELRAYFDDVLAGRRRGFDDGGQSSRWGQGGGLTEIPPRFRALL